MKYIFISLAIFVLPFSNKAGTRLSTGVLQDTITNLSQLTTNAIYKAPNGKTYHVSFEPEQPTLLGNHRRIGNARAIANTTAAPNVACDNGNKFDGTYRSTAKRSIANHNAASTNLAKLITRVQAIDNESIAVTSTSPRTTIEDSVVTLVSVFLYAIAREADEDYHVIIGTSATASTANFFNVECSGLPPTSNSAFSKLNAVRKKVVDFLGGEERCTSGYLKFTPPIKVKIIGSLFYDKGH